MGTPSAVSSHRVEGALSPKYHVQANVALRGHSLRRPYIAVSWTCWPLRESTLFTLMIVSKYVNTAETLHVGTPRNPALSPSIVSKRVEHNRPVECGHSQGINSVALILSQRNLKNIVFRQAQTKQVKKTIETLDVGTLRSRMWALPVLRPRIVWTGP